MIQNDQIKYHLENFGPISPIEALKLYGCFRLASRIKDLRNMNINITTDRSHGYAVYSLTKEEQKNFAHSS